MAVPEQLPEFAVDPNVVVPKHIRDAAAAADAIHAAAYPTETPPQPDPEPVEPPPQPDLPVVDNAPPLQPDQQLTAAVNPENFSGTPTSQDMKDSTWAGRYNAMHGRFMNSQREIAAMRDQLNTLAGELQATQRLLEGRQHGSTATQPQSGQHHEQLITQHDRDTYGEELIDLTQRAARAAVEPEITALRQENNDLRKRVITTAQDDLRSDLLRAVPNWQAINASPEFNEWLHLRNVYSGEVRGKVLRAAYNSADAHRVVAIFKDFMNEVRATGGELPGAQQPTQQAKRPAPREAAIQLETLAAPGRARPSGGGDPQSLNADKPTYSRAQISQHFKNARLAQNGIGPYAGRPDLHAATEADIGRAQNEGRIR